jgi:predicted RNA binding protein with dsRBD fold (UPF0201 family)
MTLFDEIVLSKRNRGRTSIFSGRSTTDFLSDLRQYLLRNAIREGVRQLTLCLLQNCNILGVLTWKTQGKLANSLPYCIAE